jgi:hypothetical protein
MQGVLRHIPALVLVIAMAVIFVCWSDPAPRPESLSPGPQTMEEVIAIAQNLRLHYRSDRQDGCIDSRLIVSEGRLTLEQVALLSPACFPEHPDWIGKVAVYRTGRPLGLFIRIVLGSAPGSGVGKLLPLW